MGEGPELERLIYATYDLKLEDYINFVGKVSHEETKNFIKKLIFIYNIVCKKDIVIQQLKLNQWD